MALAIQLSLLESNTEFDILCRELESTRLEYRNFHRSIRCALDAQAKEIRSLRAENDSIKSFLIDKGAKIEEINPIVQIKEKKSRKKSKIQELHPNLPGF